MSTCVSACRNLSSAVQLYHSFYSFSHNTRICVRLIQTPIVDLKLPTAVMRRISTRFIYCLNVYVNIIIARTVVLKDEHISTYVWSNLKMNRQNFCLVLSFLFQNISYMSG